MGMPIELVLVRHGESEGNVANHASREGDEHHFTAEFMARHSSSWRLTQRGVEQATRAGEWIRSHINDGQFDGYFVSSYARARETAAHLQLPNAHWRIDDNLREQDWGILDVMPDRQRQEQYPDIMGQRKTHPYYWSSLSGESMANLSIRLKAGVLDTLHREFDSRNVVIVSHGNVMWGFRYALERMTPEQYVKLDKSPDPGQRIDNCQVLYYTRKNPQTGEIAPYLNWVRSVCGWDPSKPGFDWQSIERKKYTNEELIASLG